MTDRETALLIGEEPAENDDFRLQDVRQSVGLMERRCTDSEVLQCLIEAESSRQDLERYAKELSRLVDQSVKTTREAQTAVQARSDFLAMMSHEIRTPLNGIIGMTSVLLSKELGAEERDCVETIRHSGEALLSIIDEILDFSKIEAGCLELECAEFEIAEAVEGAMQIVGSAASRKEVCLLQAIDPNLPKIVRGDVARLRQILLNLLSNAIKFTEAGNVKLRAELVTVQHGEYELRFSVTDEGIGISPEQQTRLFRPFSQADPSIARKFGGTGLGLAICKRLAEGMGGTIGVRSHPGQGSCFWFTIKALPCQSTAEEQSRPGKTDETEPAVKKDFRILLVEDNSINQKVALLMLRGLGYRADVAKNGAEALAFIASQRYDLVLMDCLMPEMDGFEATRRIRSENGYAAQIPIIAMTANAFAHDRKACLEAGMTDYLSKPVREIELRYKLNFWLSGKGHRLGSKATAAV
jgi:signal transduction histidine kinase